MIELTSRLPCSESYRPNAITYLMLLLLTVAWPAISFYFLDEQLSLTRAIADPLAEIYLPTIGIQLFMLAIVMLAAKSEQAPLADVGLRDFSRWTVPLALGFLLLAAPLLAVLQLLILSSSPESVVELSPLLPRTAQDRTVWVILCAIVAVSEELAFRGYLLTRLTRLLRGRLWLAALLTTLSFASGHLYQGFGGFVVIFAYGLLFVALFASTGSLYPGIIAHFLQNVSVLLLSK